VPPRCRQEERWLQGPCFWLGRAALARWRRSGFWHQWAKPIHRLMSSFQRILFCGGSGFRRRQQLMARPQASNHLAKAPAGRRGTGRSTCAAQFYGAASSNRSYPRRQDQIRLAPPAGEPSAPAGASHCAAAVAQAARNAGPIRTRRSTAQRSRPRLVQVDRDPAASAESRPLARRVRPGHGLLCRVGTGSQRALRRCRVAGVACRGSAVTEVLSMDRLRLSSQGGSARLRSTIAFRGLPLHGRQDGGPRSPDPANSWAARTSCVDGLTRWRRILAVNVVRRSEQQRDRATVVNFQPTAASRCRTACPSVVITPAGTPSARLSRVRKTAASVSSMPVCAGPGADPASIARTTVPGLQTGCRDRAPGARSPSRCRPCHAGSETSRSSRCAHPASQPVQHEGDMPHLPGPFSGSAEMSAQHRTSPQRLLPPLPGANRTPGPGLAFCSGSAGGDAALGVSEPAGFLGLECVADPAS